MLVTSIGIIIHPINDTLPDLNDKQKHTGNDGKERTLIRPIAISILDAQQTLRDLVGRFENTWDFIQGRFQSDFTVPQFVRIMTCYNYAFLPLHDPTTEFGIIEKIDVNPDAKIFVRADLHGDLKSVLESLKALQEDGLLDNNYICAPNTYLIFLGDYVDRGYHNLETLAVLQILTMINKDHLFLLRGNHETVEVNRRCNKRVEGTEKADAKFAEVLQHKEYSKALATSYDSMSLSLYVAEKHEGRRKYVQFSHTGFECTVDPAPLIDSPASIGRMKASKQFTFSKRMTDLYARARESDAGMDQKRKTAVLTLAELASQESTESFRSSKKIKDAAGNPLIKNGYSWSYINRSSDSSIIKDVDSEDGWQYSPLAIRSYQLLSSDNHDVEMLVRGHDHVFSDLVSEEGHVFVKTLPVGVDSPVSKKRGPVRDTSWIITTKKDVNDWTKDIYVRSQKTSSVERHFSHGFKKPQVKDIEVNKHSAE